MSVKKISLLFLYSGFLYLATNASDVVWPFCPNSTCLCRNNSKFVSMNCSEMVSTEIPAPPDIGYPYELHLTLSLSNISNLSNATFTNIANDRLVSILFFKNRISAISTDAFVAFKRLQNVVFSENNVAMSDLTNALKSLQHVPVKNLTLSSSGINSIPSEFFSPLANHSNLRLSLVNNTLRTYDGHVFAPLKGLVYLNLRGNRISKMNMTQGYVQNLSRLRLEDNYFDTLPTLCRNLTSYFPKLINLDVSFNYVKTLPRTFYECLKTLKKLNLNGNWIKYLHKNQFFKLTSLEELKLSYMSCSLKRIHVDALHSDSLEKLFFRKNRVQFERNRNFISLSIFTRCPNLKLLNINFNVLTYINNKKFDKVFRNLTKLETLVMGGCALTFVPKAISDRLSNLVSLSLYHNEIQYIPYHISTLKNLTRINMANNEITTVNQLCFPHKLLHDRKGMIKLSSNPLSCGCESLWFIKKIQRDPYLFRALSSSKGYRCHSPSSLGGTDLRKVPISEQKCLLSWNILLIILVGSSVLITLLVVTSLLFYFRWNLMYMLFMLRYKERKETATREWVYDAFVAYNIDDIGWVKEKLMPVLEGKDNLKLCIHNRDFEVGQFIIDNIVDSIDKSRKVIIVLSNNFAKSTWCQFELDLVLRHVIESGERLLVVVMLESIEEQYQSKSMKVLVRTTTYLEWGEEEEVERAFYNRLRLMVKKPITVPRAARRKLSV